MRAQQFEDLIAWQKARELTRMIYTITRTGDFAHDFGLRDQIQRASVSVMSNIAEGFERGSYKEYLQFLAIAKGSCAEVRSQLYAALDVGYLTNAEFSRLSQAAREVALLLGALRASIAESRQPKP